MIDMASLPSCRRYGCARQPVRRLIAAHGEAVKTAMAHVEKHMAATRIRDGGTVSREATGNLVIASFQNGTSRAQDPQLHTHDVIMNATKGEDGSWRKP